MADSSLLTKVKGHCKQILNKISASSEVACFGFIYTLKKLLG